jgi:hypothetical protein
MRIGKIASWAVFLGLWWGSFHLIAWLIQGARKPVQFIIVGLLLGILILLRFALPVLTRRATQAIEAKLTITHSPQFTVLRVIALLGLFGTWVTMMFWLPDYNLNPKVWLAIWIAVLVVALNLLENFWTTRDLQTD